MLATNGGGQAWSAPILLLVGGLTLLGLGLRLLLFNDSFHGDELSTYFVVNGFGVDSVINLVEGKQEGTPPLYYLLAAGTGLADTPEELRTIPLLAGVATIPLTYAVGLRTVGRTAAMVGAALVALSPFLIFYSTEARAYSLAMLFSLLSTWAMLRALEDDRWPWWAAYAVCVAGAMYSHYTAVFVLAGQFGWAFLARPEARRPLLLATAGAVALYLPWIPGFLDDGNQPASKIIEVIHPFSLRSGYDDVIHWAVGLHTDRIELIPPSSVSIALIEAGLLLGAVALAIRLRGEGLAGWLPSKPVMLVLVLAAATPVGAAIYSSFADSVFLPRNLITSSPGLALSMGALVAAGRGWLRIAAIGVLVAGFALGAIRRVETDQQRPDYSGVVSYIEDEGEPGDPIIEQPEPTPGPQTALEAEIAPPGEGTPRSNPVTPLGLAPLAERLESRSADGVGPVVQLPAPSSGAVAEQAVRQARNGRIFVVNWGGSASLAQLKKSPINPVGLFLNALPPRFQEAGSRSFPGFEPYGLTVYVLEDRAARAQ